MIRFRGIVAAGIAGILGAGTPAAGADEARESAFDRLWSHATLYENAADPTIQKLALVGRLQVDSAWFDADEGQYSDAFI